nr:hypothetical protein [Tanacetum cinerariifolium]
MCIIFLYGSDSEQRTHEFMLVYLVFASVYVWIGIETTDQETKITATVDGKPRTIFESSLRRHLKLNDKEGISSLSNAELFENLSLMGYNILPNQMFTFQKGQFSHQWKFLIYTIMQCLSPKDAGQDRENIAKTSAMPHESSPRVPSLDADEGNMQQRLHKLMELCTSLQRAVSRGCSNHKRDNRYREELGANKSTEKGSNDTEAMLNVLSSMEAANILSRGGAAVSVSPADVFPTAGVPTVSGSFLAVSLIFTTASVVTPYTRRSRGITIGSSKPIRIPIISAKDKGKEKVIDTEMPKKRKLQEQIDAHVAREMEEEFARENQRLSEQVARDSEIARIHAEEELKMMIEGLDRSNEVIAKHLIWKQWEDFVPMSSEEETERVKRQGLKIDQGSLKRVKISKGVSEEELKGMMQLYPLKEVYIKALQQFDREGLHQLWTLVKETFSIKQATRDKEKELWVELKRLFEPNSEYQLWTHHQAFIHDPLN